MPVEFPTSHVCSVVIDVGFSTSCCCRSSYDSKPIHTHMFINPKSRVTTQDTKTVSDKIDYIIWNIRRYNEETKFPVTPSFVLTHSSDSI